MNGFSSSSGWRQICYVVKDDLQLLDAFWVLWQVCFSLKQSHAGFRWGNRNFQGNVGNNTNMHGVVDVLGHVTNTLHVRSVSLRPLPSLFTTGSRCIAQAGLGTLDPLASSSAGITGVSHHAQCTFHFKNVHWVIEGWFEHCWSVVGLDYVYQDTTLWKRFSKKRIAYSVSEDSASACSVNFPSCFIFPCDNCDFLSPVSINLWWLEWIFSQPAYTSPEKSL